MKFPAIVDEKQLIALLGKQCSPIGYKTPKGAPQPVYLVDYDTTGRLCHCATYSSRAHARLSGMVV